MEENTTQPNPTPPFNPTNFDQQRPVEYAGFWMRFAAALIDGIILAIVQLPLNLIFGPSRSYTYHNGHFEFHSEASASSLISIVIGWIYFAYMESSERQATLGKMALGIVVTDEDGKRLSFANATGRHFAKWISAIILLIGFMMAGWTDKKQALHDIIARALVVVKRK